MLSIAFVGGRGVLSRAAFFPTIMGIPMAEIDAKVLNQRTILFKLLTLMNSGLEKSFHLQGANHVRANYVEPSAESHGRPRVDH
jgi:hypothetical protein